MSLLLGICFTSPGPVSVGDYIILYPQELGDVQLGHLPTPDSATTKRLGSLAASPLADRRLNPAAGSRFASGCARGAGAMGDFTQQNCDLTIFNIYIIFIYIYIYILKIYIYIYIYIYIKKAVGMQRKACACRK